MLRLKRSLWGIGEAFSSSSFLSLQSDTTRYYKNHISNLGIFLERELTIFHFINILGFKQTRNLFHLQTTMIVRNIR